MCDQLEDRFGVSWGEEITSRSDDKRLASIKRYESFYLQGTRYCQHDTVYMQSPDGPPFIARIGTLFENQKKEKQMFVRWFSRPSELPESLPDVDYSENCKEVFMAWGCGAKNLNNPASTLRKCTVLCTAEEKWNTSFPSIEDIAAADHIFDRAYDPKAQKMLSLDVVVNHFGEHYVTGVRRKSRRASLCKDGSRKRASPKRTGKERVSKNTAHRGSDIKSSKLISKDRTLGSQKRPRVDSSDTLQSQQGEEGLARGKTFPVRTFSSSQAAHEGGDGTSLHWVSKDRSVDSKMGPRVGSLDALSSEQAKDGLVGGKKPLPRASPKNSEGERIGLQAADGGSDGRILNSQKAPRVDSSDALLSRQAKEGLAGGRPSLPRILSKQIGGEGERKSFQAARRGSDGSDLKSINKERTLNPHKRPKIDSSDALSSQQLKESLAGEMTFVPGAFSKHNEEERTSTEAAHHCGDITNTKSASKEKSSQKRPRLDIPVVSLSQQVNEALAGGKASLPKDSPRNTEEERISSQAPHRRSDGPNLVPVSKDRTIDSQTRSRVDSPDALSLQQTKDAGGKTPLPTASTKQSEEQRISLHAGPPGSDRTSMESDFKDKLFDSQKKQRLDRLDCSSSRHAKEMVGGKTVLHRASPKDTLEKRVSLQAALCSSDGLSFKAASKDGMLDLQKKSRVDSSDILSTQQVTQRLGEEDAFVSNVSEDRAKPSSESRESAPSKRSRVAASNQELQRESRDVAKRTREDVSCSEMQMDNSRKSKLSCSFDVPYTDILKKSRENGSTSVIISAKNAEVKFSKFDNRNSSVNESICKQSLNPAIQGKRTLLTENQSKAIPKPETEKLKSDKVRHVEMSKPTTSHIAREEESPSVSAQKGMRSSGSEIRAATESGGQRSAIRNKRSSLGGLLCTTSKTPTLRHQKPKPELASSRDHPTPENGSPSEKDRRELFEQPKSKIFKFPWQASLEVALDQGKALLLQNLDPGFSSFEIEAMLQEVLRISCDVRMLPPRNFACYTSGEALVLYRSQTMAEGALRMLTENWLIWSKDERPVLASWAKRPLSKAIYSRGFLSVDKFGFRSPNSKDKASALATSHCSQPNTVEYEMGIQWRLLQDRHREAWTIATQEHKLEIDNLVHKMKPEGT